MGGVCTRDGATKVAHPVLINESSLALEAIPEEEHEQRVGCEPCALTSLPPRESCEPAPQRQASGAAADAPVPESTATGELPDPAQQPRHSSLHGGGDEPSTSGGDVATAMTGPTLGLPRKTRNPSNSSIISTSQVVPSGMRTGTTHANPYANPLRKKAKSKTSAAGGAPGGPKPEGSSPDGRKRQGTKKSGGRDLSAATSFAAAAVMRGAPGPAPKYPNFPCYPNYPKYPPGSPSATSVASAFNNSLDLPEEGSYDNGDKWENSSDFSELSCILPPSAFGGSARPSCGVDGIDIPSRDPAAVAAAAARHIQDELEHRAMHRAPLPPQHQHLYPGYSQQLPPTSRMANPHIAVDAASLRPSNLQGKGSCPLSPLPEGEEGLRSRQQLSSGLTDTRLSTPAADEAGQPLAALPVASLPSTPQAVLV